MFQNVELGCLNSFYQPDHQVHITRYGKETAALRQSRESAIFSLLQLDVLIVPKCDANFNEAQPRPRKTKAKFFMTLPSPSYHNFVVLIIQPTTHAKRAPPLKCSMIKSTQTDHEGRHSRLSPCPLQLWPTCHGCRRPNRAQFHHSPQLSIRKRSVESASRTPPAAAMPLRQLASCRCCCWMARRRARGPRARVWSP